MGILEAAKPAIIICTRDRSRATAFYRHTLGLKLAYEDGFAAVLNKGGVTLRVSTVADFTPHEHPILGFRVPNVAATVRALREKAQPSTSISTSGKTSLASGRPQVERCAWLGSRTPMATC